MNGQTTQWVFNLILWAVVEVILNIVGLDDLATYSEFLFEFSRCGQQQWRVRRGPC